jgi:RNA polymerase sigma-70 factor (ECF subfamily)
VALHNRAGGLRGGSGRGAPFLLNRFGFGGGLIARGYLLSVLRFSHARTLNGTTPQPAEPWNAQSGIEALFSRYAGEVAALGLTMLGKKDEAEDLVQDVFLRAWRGLANLRAPELVKPWLMTIAIRLARTRLRRRRLSRILWGAGEPDYEHVAASGATADDKLLLQRLFCVLDAMPVNLRTPWVLRNMHAEKVEEIAKMCGWSLSTTKRRLGTAQRRVNKALR